MNQASEAVSVTSSVLAASAAGRPAASAAGTSASGAVAAVASWLGWPGDVRLLRALILAAFSIFTLLMAREAVKAIDRLRVVRLAGRSRVVAYGVFALSPTLLIGVLGYGHVEQPMMLWLVLFAVRQIPLSINEEFVDAVQIGVVLAAQALLASLRPQGSPWLPRFVAHPHQQLLRGADPVRLAEAAAFVFDTHERE